MSIGSLYNARGVVVGQAAAFLAVADTPLPADTLELWDETVWLRTVVQTGAPSAGDFTLTLSGGPFLVPTETAVIAFDATAGDVGDALADILPAGYTAIVTGDGSVADPYLVTIVGAGSAEILITGDGTGLTAGTFLTTSSPWYAPGGTEQGWQVNYNPNVVATRIEEQPTPVQEQVDTADFTFVANLAQNSIDNLQYALSATKTVQAADTTHFQKSILTLQPVLPVYTVCVEAKNRFGLPRRYYVPRAVTAVNVGQSFRRAASAQLVPVTFMSICNLDEIVVEEIEAGPTP